MTKPHPTEQELEYLFWGLVALIIVSLTTVVSAVCYYLL